MKQKSYRLRPTPIFFLLGYFFHIKKKCKCVFVVKLKKSYTLFLWSFVNQLENLVVNKIYDKS